MPQDGPSRGAGYWAAMSIASVFGAGLGDFISHDFHLGHWRGLLPLALLLALMLRCMRRGWIAFVAGYWMSVVVVRTAATNVADLATHDLHLGNVALLGGLAGLLLLTVASGRWGMQPAVSRPGLPAIDRRYWIALFLAGTLGTVLGDDTTGRYGQAGASILLCMILGAMFWLRWRRTSDGKAGYWSTVVAARTAGTSLGDLLADQSGLGLAGSTVASGMLLLATLLARRPDDVAAARTV